MKHSRSTLLVLSGVTAVLLSACGSEDVAGTSAPASGSTAAEKSSTPSSSTASSAASSSKSAPAATGDTTPPGTELSVGDRAVVPFEYGTDKSGTIAVTVTAIEAGDNADLAAFGEKAAGIVPIYVRVTVENVGGDDLAYSSVSLRAVGSDGRGTGVIITGDTPKCESESAPKSFTAAGETYETCVLQGARDASAVTGATFGKGGDYDDSPVLWKR
ncbi:hypothetical protein [Umezawaea beigongshangensis]|uniref:hypothetical protein n=1 Tax=Umezawaea beigongshangensis TaxID=2780383 RepID=UPI0018F1A238|nr:hypothetical protein [Umezawaea beigongshangensis]